MTHTSKSLSQQVSELTTRLESLERRLGAAKISGGVSANSGELDRFCALPEVPERTFGRDVSPDRARLIQLLGKKWVNGTKLRYYFFDNGPFSAGNEQTDLVREGFDVWSNVGIGISFEEVGNIADAEIRIGFLRGDGAWSYVGRDVIDIPGQFERTMNFGWDLTTDPRGVDTPVHEIGHTLGFPHEHQNPIAGIVWDDEAVYDYCGAPPNSWSRDVTFHNVLRKLSRTEVQGSDWDPDSIMHYAFAPGLIRQPDRYRQSGIQPQPGLSPKDIEQARRFYPPHNDSHNPSLQPFRLERLALSPGEQKDFDIQPAYTDDFTIQSIGRSDTVMVLFQEVNGQLRYVDGDDDSGTSLNARITARLRQGEKYVLRIRLYLNYASGDTAVLMH